jgi:hypothetical protein
MHLTTAQLAVLKADILTSFPGAGPDDDSNAAIAAAYNFAASPVFRVWKTSLLTMDVKKSVVWTEFIGRSAGEREAFIFMLSDGKINPSDVNVRQGIADVFSGGTGAATRAALIALAKRDATRAERLFATGEGSDATPGTLTVEGNLSGQDISAARNS